MESLIFAIIIGIISLVSGWVSRDKEKEKPSLPTEKAPAAEAKRVKPAVQRAERAQERVGEKTREEVRRKGLDRQERHTGRLSRYEPAETGQERASEQPDLRLTADDAAKGVIWSEILAPPKALRKK
ncbi:hypothetical protein [Bacillus thermotolerans]|uniref:Uncharacterized protein n=1 Tax=Bacillus thermotolerans TaxID=1221996 RepID=A0A0F5HSZ4_BACTR|nr:hypothetical protein [Bacillus thermotolerans]KKB36426.1 hypothetical protein QY97_01042 [Bacillus thermotolerans]KKB43202.1 hypothetical protein QY95_02188 [Bacillus thermotolerans]KKB43605.1 hypothetical protein QY96_00842 [Bacillus thermotolerans]